MLHSEIHSEVHSEARSEVRSEIRSVAYSEAHSDSLIRALGGLLENSLGLAQFIVASLTRLFSLFHFSQNFCCFTN